MNSTSDVVKLSVIALNWLASVKWLAFEIAKKHSIISRGTLSSNISNFLAKTVVLPVCLQSDVLQIYEKLNFH